MTRLASSMKRMYRPSGAECRAVPARAVVQDQVINVYARCAWLHRECSDRLGLHQVLETYAMFVATQLAQSTLVTRAIWQKLVQNGLCAEVGQLRFWHACLLVGHVTVARTLRRHVAHLLAKVGFDCLDSNLDDDSDQ